ncbi:hypothetical protein ScPMuIL_015216 [Solemya velum]
MAPVNIPSLYRNKTILNNAVEYHTRGVCPNYGHWDIARQRIAEERWLGILSLSTPIPQNPVGQDERRNAGEQKRTNVEEPVHKH